jgi:hypothetical protein
MRTVVTIASLFTLLIGTADRKSGATVDVPRGATAVIDGRVDDLEWRHAAVHRLSDGSVLRLQHDGRYLFLAVSAARRGYPSVCIASGGGSVRVFHASAALGSITYAKGAETWETGERQFEYGMRTPDLTEQARAERRRYMADHDWVASTVQMGDGLAHEMQVSLEIIPNRSALALAYFVSDGGAFGTWPDTLRPSDGCRDEQLVRGYVSPRLQFEPTAWATVAIRR